VFFSGSSSCFGMEGFSASEICEFFLWYDCDVFDIGAWDHPADIGNDYHAFQPAKWTRYMWLINSRVYHIQGDSWQTNTSNQWTYVHEDRPHYMWIAGCEMYENYENAIDHKNCYHIIATSNLIHDFRNAFKPANETAFTLSQDSEGYLSGYHWAINNIIYNAGVAIRDSSTSASILTEAPHTQVQGDRNYIVGNLIYDVDEGLELEPRSFDHTDPSDRTYSEFCGVALNTIVSDMPVTNPRGAGSSSYTIDIQNNIVYGATGSEDIAIEAWAGLTCNVLDNLVDRPAGSVNLPTGNFDSFLRNLIDQDPEFTNIGAKNFIPLASSPAVNNPGAVTTPILQEFADLYGMSISEDLVGTTRPQGAIIDLGAYEVA